VSERRPGLREVLIVSGITLAVVALAVIVTAVLPSGGQYIVLRTPLLIVVLIAGTAGVLWRITRPGRPER
jgi:FtsH-binding integral membrane protein